VLTGLIIHGLLSKLYVMDYYKILGVAESASAEEIKQAYRALAVKLHPDKNPSSDAEQQFKQINQAHSVLSDPQKRAEYDQQRRHAHAGGFSMHNMHGSFGAGIDDIFASIFGHRNWGNTARMQRNADTAVQIQITLEEAHTGTSLPVQFVDSSGHTVNITVNIPAGVANNTRFKYPGNGTRTNTALPPGDLYVSVLVQPHARFERQGANLITGVTINMWQSILGVTKTVTGLTGNTLQVSVPAGSTESTVLRIAGQGMHIKAGTASRGDLFVRLTVTPVMDLSDQQKQLLAEWADQLDTGG
jgi:curved DNA-binding protein